MTKQSVFDRFPAKYRLNDRGGAVFRDWGSVSEEHDKWLPETHFPIVGVMTRHPAYRNRRSVDPFVEMFYEDVGYTKAAEWGLPVPNEEASYKSLAKYAKDSPFMDDEQVRDMNRAWEWTSAHFGQYMRNSRVRDLEQVVEKLDKTTSSGAPYNLLYATKGDLLEHDESIMSTFADSWELLATDPNHTYMCTNSLKEEIRPTEKTLQNKIRTFTAMAVDATVDGNRLFADMNENMNSAWLKSASTVGWSPMNGNWGRFLAKLKVHPNGYALDESEYDSSLRSYMMWGCARFRWTCLREEDQTPANLQRIKTYYRNLVNTLIISPEGVLILKLGGNPSGSCNTINDNTLILFTLLSYAWIRNVPEKEETTLGEFLSNVSMALCGDDNTWTVSDEAHPFFNGKSVCAEFSTIGVITTSDCYDPRPAEDLDYLSAHTVYLKGFAVPQYNREKILTSLLYSNKAKHTPANALTRASGMLVCGYTDVVLRKFLRGFIDWLLVKFDKVCYDEPDWIIAKTGILSDQRLFDLWTGTSFFLHEQSFQSCTNDTGIKRTMSSQVRTKKQRRAKRGIGAKTLTRKPRVVVVQQQAAKRGRKRGQRRGRGARERGLGRFIGPVQPGNMRLRSLTGQGNVRNSTTNRRMMVLEEDEYIGEVIGGSTGANFNNTAYPVNIGQAGTFPWGSGVVKNNYEKYQFDYLEFYFKREVSEFATPGTTGKVIMSFDADASDGPPTTKQAMEDTDPHVDCMPSENMALRIPPHMLKKFVDGYFIRPAGLPGAADIKTYDVGILHVATIGLAANSATVGELHVRYRCRVMIPVLDNANGAPQNNSVSWFESASGQTYATTVATTALNGTAKTNGIGITNTSGSFVPPVGNYLVEYQVNGTDNTGESFQIINDFRKNGASVPTNPPLVKVNTAPGATTLEASGSLYVSANGTDTFVQTITMTGAAGTLTGLSSVRWTAI